MTYDPITGHPKPVNKFQVVDKGIVDNEPWVVVSCTKEVSMWIRDTFRQKEHTMWYDHIDARAYIHSNVFEMHEKLYTELVLRWM